jgi:hypothetical protein
MMAIEIKEIETLEGKDAERFIEHADEAERKHSFVLHSHNDIVFSLPSANIRLLSQSRISAMFF